MNTEALFLFLILLLGLVLCSFLGGNCNKEGFDISSAENSISNLYNTGVSSANNVYNSVANNVSSSFGNYNHYTGYGSSSQLQNGMTFTDPSGDTITVITNSDGTLSLKAMTNGLTLIFNSTPPANSNIKLAPNTFFAPIIGAIATIITDSNNQIAVKVNVENDTIIFTQTGSSNNSYSNLDQTTSTQYYGSTGNPIQTSSANLAYGGSTVQYNGPYGGSAGYAQGPYGGSAGYAQGPYGGSVGYAQGPNGNSVYGSNNSSSGYGDEYYSTLPTGIPASQIPPGKEDLYILKSEIVPPVCPACPVAQASCPREEKCPPCPACARCPEPAFECKKVPNYNAISDQYLPQPVLNDFSQFGM
jgi:hypothetical protein